MAITRTAMVDDDGSGTTGTIINNAWKTEFYNQIDAALPAGSSGQWTDIAFNAADYYTTDAGTSFVASTPLSAAYTQVGKMVTWSVYVNGTVTGAPATIFVKLPAGFVAARYHIGQNVFTNISVGPADVGSIQMAPGGTKIDLARSLANSPTWAAGTMYIGFTVTFSIQ